MKRPPRTTGRSPEKGRRESSRREEAGSERDARVPYPAAAYAFIAQLVWVLSGQLTLADGPAAHVLTAGDTFVLGEPRPRVFSNETARDCRYLVVVTRT